MNGLQRIILWIGIITVVLMGLFPPWTYTMHLSRADGGRMDSEKPAGYYFLFSSPPPELPNLPTGAELDTTRLLIQWFVVSVLTSGFIYLSAGGKHKNRN
jgi:hypothetical protein